MRECVDGEVVAIVKPRGVESVYAICEGECHSNCTGVNTLTVDELLGDAEAGILGELVASTLLPTPQRIEGDEDIVAEARLAYAARIAAEEHHRLARMLGGLARLARTAHLYHLVARLARLSRLYPWAAKSLVDCISAGGGDLHALAKRSLEEAGCRGEGVWYRVCSEARGGSRRGWHPPSTRLTRIWPLVRPGAATHPLLRDPLLLVRLPRGKLRTRILGFEEQLMRVTGVERLLRARRMGIGGTVELVKGGWKSAVVKYYRLPATLKWIVAAGVALPIYPYRLAPRERLEAEYEAVIELGDKGFPVPEPIMLDLYGMRAAYEYIEGTPLHQLVAKDPLAPSLAEAAALLAQLHREGWVMGDANPSNFIVSRYSTYIVDLEQARRSDRLRHQAWDLAVLVYYTFLFNPQEPGNRAALIARAYISAGGEPHVVTEASRVVYALPFTPVAPVTVLEKARRALHHVGSGAA